MDELGVSALLAMHDPKSGRHALAHEKPRGGPASGPWALDDKIFIDRDGIPDYNRYRKELLVQYRR